MTYIRKIKRKNKNGTIKTYYAEVESVREGDKVVQRYIRSLGTDPENPTNIVIEPTHFSYLSLRLMQGSLTPNDLFEMLENMGQPVKKDELKKLGILYDFGKKTYSISLSYKTNSQYKSKPYSQTTRTRNIKTLSGERIISIQKKYCKIHGLINKENIALLNKICLPRRVFDTKVIVAIGYLRWFFNYQREEIQLLLGARGIQISTGEISILSEEFLLRFYILHKKHSSQMNELFTTNKGYILHLDGSAESGDEITFTAKEGMTEITIDSWIMPSESRQYIKPFLQHIKDTYGSPLVIIRDMSKEISDAASEVFPKVPHQICHTHYVRNLGDILFNHRYKKLLNKIVNAKILSKFAPLKKACVEGTTSKNKMVVAEHYWVMLAIEYILHPRECRSDYPFVLPYLEVMNRVIEIMSMVRKIVMWDASHNFGVGVVLKFDNYLKKLVNDKDVKLYFTTVGHIWGWFEEIRSVLRVSREFSGKEQNNVAIDADKLKTKLIGVMNKIRDEGRSCLLYTSPSPR